MDVLVRITVLLVGLGTGVSALAPAQAADPPPPPYFAADPPRSAADPAYYHDLWHGGGSDPVASGRPRRRVLGDRSYVGSAWGLGKPPVSGLGPRPDWGRSSHD